ncbi:unnamed protein product, partial [Prorocentrum cordatum]
APNGEPWRAGVGGGHARCGISGGRHRDYYRILNAAKKQGPEALARFKASNPRPREVEGALAFYQLAKAKMQPASKPPPPPPLQRGAAVRPRSCSEELQRGRCSEELQ